jgi:hypothetical protein
MVEAESPAVAGLFAFLVGRLKNMTYEYGRAFHVVGTYDGFEHTEHDAQALVDQDYLQAVSSGLVPTDSPRVVVTGPSTPLPGSSTYQLRHYLAWHVTSPTLIAGSAYLLPNGLAFVYGQDPLTGGITDPVA